MKIPTLPGFNPEAFDKYFKNTSWLMLARVGSLFIKMIMTAIVIPNYLGASLNGTLSYPLTFLALFIGACTLGTDTLVTRQLLQNPDMKNQLLGSAFRIRIIGGLICLPIIYITYSLIAQYASNAPAASFQQIAIVSVVCIVQAFQIIDSYFQSRAEGKYIMYVQIGANVLSALIKFFLVYVNASIDAFIWSLVLDIVLIQLGYIFFYKKKGNDIFSWTYDSNTAKQLLSLGWPLAFSAIFVSLYMRIGQLMVDAYMGREPLGVYNTVIQYTESWYFVPIAICTALFPAIMNFRKFQPKMYEHRLKNLYDLMMIISVSIAALIYVFAPYFYSIFYADNPEFLIGAKVLQINAWAGVFAFLGTASSQYLLAEGYTKISLWRTLIGAICNIVLNIIWIPKYGLFGASYALLFSQFISVFSIVFFQKTRHHAYVMLESLFFLKVFKFLFGLLSRKSS